MIKRTLIIVAIVVAAVAVFVLGCALYGDIPDVELPNQIEVTIADAENAYGGYQAAGANIDYSHSIGEYRLIESFVALESWDQEEVDRLLLGHDADFEAMDRANTRAVCYGPVPESFFEARPDPEPFIRLMRLRRLRAVNHALADDDRAVQDIRALLVYSKKYESGATSLTQFLVGRILSVSCYELINTLLMKELLDHAELLDLSSALEEADPGRSGYRRAIVLDAQRTLAFVDEFKEGLLKRDCPDCDKAIEFFSLGTPSLIDSPDWYKNYLLMPNRTKRRILKQQDHLLELVDNPAVCWEYSTQKPSELARKLHPLNTTLMPNGVGAAISGAATGSQLKSHVGMCQSVLKCEVLYRVLRLKIAARLYLLDRGMRIDSLDDLVPEYLPAVPADPFGESSIRFTPETGMVHSVGYDCIDSDAKVAEAEIDAANFNLNPSSQPRDFVFQLHSGDGDE
ncbi:MAG: hypothetical protein H6678_15300 [Candidatus Delongbacteria bacterium]|nr:hypothetical protein [Candidatus Delongbacteria bacterium]